MEFNNEMYDDNEGQNEFEETEDQEDQVQEYYPQPKAAPVKRKPRQIQPQPIQYNPYEQYQGQGAAAQSMEIPPPKKRGRPKKVQQEEQESYEQQVYSKPPKLAREVPQQQNFDHQCYGCGQDFDCQDGKMTKAGAFKCSCLKVGRGKSAAFFHNEHCIQLAEE